MFAFLIPEFVFNKIFKSLKFLINGSCDVSLKVLKFRERERGNSHNGDYYNDLYFVSLLK